MRVGLKIGGIMTALLSKIHPPKVSKNGGMYYKLEFITKPENEWTYTYISPTNYNFDRWKNIIEGSQAIMLQGLEYKEGTKIIDADSKVFYKKYSNNTALFQQELF